MEENKFEFKINIKDKTSLEVAENAVDELLKDEDFCSFIIKYYDKNINFSEIKKSQSFYVSKQKIRIVAIKYNLKTNDIKEVVNAVAEKYKEILIQRKNQIAGIQIENKEKINVDLGLSEYDRNFEILCNKKSKIISNIGKFIITAAFLVVGFCVYYDLFLVNKRPVIDPDFNLVVNSKNFEEILVDEYGLLTYAGVAEKCMPFIVELYGYEDSFSKDKPRSIASGIIISENGYILTNAHCVKGAQRVEIVLQNDEKYDAKLVGRDSKSDIAVIKIEAKNLPFATFYDSEKVLLGERVAVLGNPASYTKSITSGIISGTKRLIKVESTSYAMECFQTNAAISPGNSGGALVNMRGEVIGIVSSKYYGEDYEGLGFAITVKAAKPIIDDIIKYGFISERYRIGIYFVSTYTSLGKNLFMEGKGFELPEDENGKVIKGILIGKIMEDAKISESDLKAYDIITHINGVEVYDFDTTIKAIDGLDDKKLIKSKVIRYESISSDAAINSDGKQKYEELEIEFYLTEDKSGDF